MRKLAHALILSASLLALACTDISGSSTAVLSLQFDSLPSPSVVVDDTLRDTTGAVVLPVVHAFNYKGNEIATAQIYLATLRREPPCRFDAVLIDGATPPQIEWQRDIFAVD